ncbi:dermonecrotic toxin domain-containing protein [Pseudomonas atagonensis]|uniref:dermonecrotic toxin domain-containing protein n=1 Tax=Pseudomonas atagonensis TaxID=2609964 RepID=UPI00140E7F4C|nr:DUF6543 domain-containing protein [Pseudomonas atagonensis]
MTDDAAPAVLPPSTALLGKSELVSQTSHGPTLGTVASQVLSDALKEMYPDLTIDPDRSMIATPQWLIVQNDLVPGVSRFESLSHTLVRLSLFDETANFIAGEHFLTTEPDAPTPLQLAVDIEDIAALLNDYAPLLFVEYQARQLDFWNQTGKRLPRWQELAESLRKALNVKQVQGWNADECAMAQQVFLKPDKSERSDDAFTNLQACLIDIDTVEDGISQHLMIGGALVLRATHQSRELITMFTIESGYESFESLEKLGESLPARITGQLAGRAMQWRLFEPDGNVFDHMAWALVASQLDSIDALRRIDTAPVSAAAPGLAPKAPVDEQVRLDSLEAAIPEWLLSASPADIAAYGQYITRLGQLYQEPTQKSAKDEIESISQYAQREMREAIVKDKQAEGAAALPLDELEITITNSFTGGNLTLPNPLDTHTETLAEFALENAAPYLTSLRFKDATTVPEWLTADLLLRLSRQIDVGKTYPQMLKRKLIDDPVEVKRQARLYEKQLRLLLPLAALECKVRHENGVDETGYNYIVQLMDEIASDLQALSICPLTLIPQHRVISSKDTVTNMFIIGPTDPANGPCLLYRPLSERPLMQFPSRQNLLYALHQPGELRDSVLAWLPDKAMSFEYAQYVFPVGLPSPWLITQQLNDPLLSLNGLGRVTLGNEAIDGDRLRALFDNNAEALVALADRESQSNAEQRWALLRDSGWALFNVASNFLSGALGTAVWVWQSIDALQQALDAHERGDRFAEWTSLGDMLLTLGIILTHHAVMRRQAASGKAPRRSVEVETPVKPEAVSVTVTFDKASLRAELKPEHCSSIEVAGSVPRRAPTAMGAFLDTLEVDKPDLASENLSRINEQPPYLYQLDDKTYASVGERWFEVSVDADEQITINYPGDPARSGPSLKRAAHGLWDVDLRLRLRGGGPKSRREVKKKEKAKRRLELEKEFETFKADEVNKKQELLLAQANIKTATPQTLAAMIDLYAAALEVRMLDYEQALKNLKEYRANDGTTGYVYNMLRLNTELQKHISLWYNIKGHQYNKLARQLIEGETADPPLPRQTFVDIIGKATELGQQFVERLTFARTSLVELKALGRAGITRAIELESLLAESTPLDFKVNEIGMAQELCLQDQTGPLMKQARDALAQILVNAAGAAREFSVLMKGITPPVNPEATLQRLNRLIDVFADADQRIQDLPEQHPGLTLPNPLMRLRTLIEEFSQLAQGEVDSVLLNNPQLVTPEVTPLPRPGPSRLAIKVSKSRPRTGSEPSSSTSQASSRPAPIENILPKAVTPPSVQPNDYTLIADALILNLDVPFFLERTEKDAQRPSRIPADMQDIFEQYARRLEQTATSVDEALARMTASGHEPLPTATLGAELRGRATDVRTKGVAVRADLYKNRKPTSESLEWMNTNRQLQIDRNPKGRIKTRQMGDYFQEYRIFYKDPKSQKNQLLWVAHFHYPNEQTPVDQPATAHLKIADAYLKDLTPALRSSLTSFAPIDGVLRKINAPELRQLFFDLEPKAASSST